MHEAIVEVANNVSLVTLATVVPKRLKTPARTTRAVCRTRSRQTPLNQGGLPQLLLPQL